MANPGTIPQQPHPKPARRVHGPARVLPIQPSPRHPRIERLVPAICCLVLLLQLMLSVRLLSQGCDESTHLYAGYRALRCGDFGYSPEHPPLGKMVAALPLLAMNAPVNCAIPARDEAYAALDWLYGQPQWQRELAWARATCAMFAVGLCVLVWFTARRMFGFATAAVATVLFVFEPNILGNGALVMTDTVLALTFTLAIVAFYLWVKKPSPSRLVFTGIATGLALVSKQSGAAIAPILAALALGDAYLVPENRAHARQLAKRNLKAVALIGVIALGVVWATYGFRYTARPGGVHLERIGSDFSSVGLLVTSLRALPLLPEAYVEGMARVRALSGPVNAMFLLGKMHSAHRWYFFPAVLIIKSTLAVLAGLGFAAFGMKYLVSRRQRELLFVILPAAGFLLICIVLNNMSSGIRHLLPVLPFALILVAAGCVELARRQRRALYFLVIAIVLHVASSLHAYPHYLSYANELLGGPSNSYRFLPNNDMGEGYLQVKQYLAKHPGEPCYLATIYLMDISNYGVPCKQFWGGPYELYETLPPRVHGIIILSSVFVENAQQAWLEPITRHKPTTPLAGSAMLAYEGDFDTRLASGITEWMATRRLLATGHLRGALQHASRAAEITPEFAGVQYDYCFSLVANDMVQEAKTQCRLARALLFEPLPTASMVSGLRSAIVARQLLQAGQPQAALQLATEGVRWAPRNGTAQSVYCQALMAVGSADATHACDAAREFVVRSIPVTPATYADAMFPVVPRGSLDLMDKLNLTLYALGER